MLGKILLRIRVKLGLRLLATSIFFGVLAWISARFLGENSFPHVLFTIMAALMFIVLILVAFAAPILENRHPNR